MTNTTAPKLSITTVTSPTYANANRTAVDCTVTFSDGGTYPYTAIANDSTDYGVKLWTDLMAGRHGSISAFPQELAAVRQSAALRDAALTALAANDLVAVRCTKAGVPYPADWLEYDRDLRAAIQSGTGPLPDRPDYPAGT